MKIVKVPWMHPHRSMVCWGWFWSSQQQWKGNGCSPFWAGLRSTSLFLWDVLSGFLENVVQVDVVSKTSPSLPLNTILWCWPEWSGSLWLLQPFHSTKAKKQFPKLGRDWKDFLLPIQPEILFSYILDYHSFRPAPEGGFCTRYLLMEFPLPALSIPKEGVRI